jgi:hypothetical protein
MGELRADLTDSSQRTAVLINEALDSFDALIAGLQQVVGLLNTLIARQDGDRES